MTLRRIGLMGGSFDPPHLAHRALGRVAREALALDELRWLPAGAPWQKAGREMASGADREAMLRLLLAGEPDTVIDTRELARPGLTYTLDTVRELQAALAPAEWFLVIGQDQYARFATWHGWQELLQRLTLAVAGRGGDAPAPPPELAALPHRVQALALPRMDIAASDIRHRVASGQPVGAMVGEAVAGYIDQHRLYQPDTQRGDER